MKFKDFKEKFLSEVGKDSAMFRAAAHEVKITSEKDIVNGLSIKDGDDFKYLIPNSGRIVVDTDNDQMFITWIPVPDLTSFLKEHKEENPGTKNCPYNIIGVYVRDYSGNEVPFFTTLDKLGNLLLNGQGDFDVHDLAYPLKANIDLEFLENNQEFTQDEQTSLALSYIFGDIRIDNEDGIIDYDGESIVNLTTKYSSEEEKIIDIDVDISEGLLATSSNIVVLVNYNSDTMGNLQFFCKYEGLLIVALVLTAKLDGIISEKDVEDIENHEQGQDLEEKCEQ